jgi:hypothetical protein
MDISNCLHYLNPDFSSVKFACKTMQLFKYPSISKPKSLPNNRNKECLE